MYKLDLEKAEELEIKLPTSVGSWEQQESSRKNIFCCFIDYAKVIVWITLLLCGSQKTVENSSRDGNTRSPDLPLEKAVCRSGSNSWNWTWNNRLVPNRKRSTSRLYRRKQWHPTPVLLPGKSHGQRSLAGPCSWGHKELYTTEVT